MDFLLTPPHKVHALKPDCGFVPPPLDGSLTVPEVFDFQYEHSPNHSVFLYANKSGGVTKLGYSRVVPAIHRAAQYVATLANINLNADPTTFPTIGVLATSDTITYTTTVLGLLRAGIPAFLISTRSSASGAAVLLSETRPSHILVSQDLSARELAENSVTCLKAAYPDTLVPIISFMPTFDQIYVTDVPHVSLPPRKQDLSLTRLIIHSSGSTSTPKPIAWNDRIYMQIQMVPHLFPSLEFGTQDLCGEVYGLHSLAMFHSTAWIVISWIATTGLVMATFEPESPATIPTPDSVFQGLIRSSCTWAFGVPSFIEQWASDEEKVKYLSQLTGLLYGGGPLNKYVGDALARQDVKLCNSYGATEFGVFSRLFIDSFGLDWEYMAVNPHLPAEFIPVGDGAYEMIVVATPLQELPVINYKYQNRDAYASNDLLAPHPTKAGLWKVLGRLDDQITLSTGEKTNPGPLESILRQDHRVAAAVMYGRGRFQNGVIIEPKKEYAFDPAVEGKLTEFRHQIWPKVEELNAVAPTHSRLFKETILVVSPSKPFTYTAKGTPRRAQILSNYESEIEGVYSALEGIAEIKPPIDWSPDNSLRFVRFVVNSVLKRAADEPEDIFDRGCDSLQATWIRNSIMHALRMTPGVSLSSISSNFVYEHPTIASLAQYVAAVASAGSEAVVSAHNAEDVVACLNRYNTSFPTHVSSSPAVDREVVLVTGTTGAVGSATLARLVVTDSVRKIFAFNRPSRKSVGIVERQKEALKSRGYDPDIAVFPKVTLVEGELTEAGLGVDAALEEEICRTITHIIHIAWRVDFNLSLASFENAVGGVRALVNLALRSPQPNPPRLQFTSSVAVLRNIKSRTTVNEIPVEDPSVPLGQGYGESKWVAEMILYAAAKGSALRPTVVRVGQVSGGINGAWSTSDWVPSIVKSSIALRCLPRLKGVCSWIPLHLAAEALVEMRNGDVSTVNLVHPYPVRCSDLFRIISQELSLPLVPYAEWEAKLEEAAAKMSHLNDSSSSAKLVDQVPAATILDFFRSGLRSDEAAVAMQGEELEVMGHSRLATKEAVKASAALRNARKLDAVDVRLWLSYWKNVGFIL